MTTEYICPNHGIVYTKHPGTMTLGNLTIPPTYCKHCGAELKTRERLKETTNYCVRHNDI